MKTRNKQNRKIDDLDNQITKLTREIDSSMEDTQKNIKNQNQLIKLLKQKIDFLWEHKQKLERKNHQINLVLLIITAASLIATVSTNINRNYIARKSGKFEKKELKLKLGGHELSDTRKNKIIILRSILNLGEQECFYRKDYFPFIFSMTNTGGKTIDEGSVMFRYPNSKSRFSAKIDTSIIKMKRIKSFNPNRKRSRVGSFDYTISKFDEIDPGQTLYINEIIYLYSLLNQDIQSTTTIIESSGLYQNIILKDSEPNIEIDFTITATGEDLETKEYSCSFVFSDYKDNEITNLKNQEEAEVFYVEYNTSYSIASDIWVNSNTKISKKRRKYE